MIKNQNFSYIEGKSLTIMVSVVDYDNTPFNFTGWSAEWVLRETTSAGTLVLTKTNATGITLATGEVEIELFPVDTNGLSGRYYHELVVTNGVDNYPVMTGYITFSTSGTS